MDESGVFHPFFRFDDERVGKYMILPERRGFLSGYALYALECRSSWLFVTIDIAARPAIHFRYG